MRKYLMNVPAIIIVSIALPYLIVLSTERIRVILDDSGDKIAEIAVYLIFIT
jgi:hypothetical protein